MYGRADGVNERAAAAAAAAPPWGMRPMCAVYDEIDTCPVGGFVDANYVRAGHVKVSDNYRLRYGFLRDPSPSHC